MYDRPPGTDISERLQRRLTCLSQAHSKIQRYNDQCEENKEREEESPPPGKVVLGVHTYRQQPNIKTCISS